MTAPRSPRLDCLTRTTYGLHDAPFARPAAALGAPEKAARKGVLSALPPTHRTLRPHTNPEGRNAA